MFQWVNFLWPLVITTTDNMKTLTVGIASLQGQFVTNWGVISAAAVMTMLPVIDHLPDLPALVRPGVDGGRAQAMSSSLGAQPRRRLMADILVKHLVKRFGKVEAVSDVSLQIADGEFLVLLGPSGCGKSTILRVVAGLEDADSGEIVIGGRLVNFIDPVKRNVAMVFQNYALYPHMTVYKNIAFPLQIAKKEQGRDRGGGPPGGRDPRARGAAAAPAGAAVRRAAPAGRARAGDRARAAGVPDGRAALQPRRAASPADAPGVDPAAPAARDHDDVRDARPGRGDDDGSPDRGDERRRAAADRNTAGRLSPAGERLRRDVPRRSADEPDRRQRSSRVDGGWRFRGARTSTCRSRPTCSALRSSQQEVEGRRRGAARPAAGALPDRRRPARTAASPAGCSSSSRSARTSTSPSRPAARRSRSAPTPTRRFSRARTSRSISTPGACMSSAPTATTSGATHRPVGRGRRARLDRLLEPDGLLGRPLSRPWKARGQGLQGLLRDLIGFRTESQAKEATHFPEEARRCIDYISDFLSGARLRDRRRGTSARRPPSTLIR